MKDYKEIKIVNGHQVLFYLDRGVQPLRLERGYDDRLVYIYSKADTYSLFGEWLEHCKEYKNMLKEQEENK